VQKLESLHRKLVSNARAILSNQIGFPLGVSKMVKLLYMVENLQPFEINVEVFHKYYEKTTGIPLGTERLEWNFEALKLEDAKLKRLEDLYKNDILEKCYELIKEYSD
jgi:hypothetical protein